MIPDIEVAVQYALAQSGKPYSTGPDRFGPNYFDCSGLIIASLRHAGITVPSNVGNSVDIYNWAKNSGGLVSVMKGVSTRGAIMIKGKWYGYGPLGHVSFSLGGGEEMAAHGRISGIHSNVMDVGFYQDAFILPGVFYASLQPPVDPAVLAAIKKLLDWKQRVTVKALHQGDTTNDVSILNDLLIHRALMSRQHKSNTYTRYTRAAVHRLKLDQRINPPDGRSFGGIAAAALLQPR